MKKVRVPKIRVKSYLEGEVIECGSGVVLSPNHVLTAEHVLCGDSHVVVWNGEERKAVIEKKNQTAALLTIETTIEEYIGEVKFTNEELLTEDMAWYVDGFITNEQEIHQMSGTGLVQAEYQENGTDFKLKNIETGYAENYQGLSGAPVICKNRIVGMLQVQDFTERGLLGLEMTSTDLFMELIPSQFIGFSEYREEFEEKVRRFTEKVVEKNIKSKKYIPDIFVEEGGYKENFRYFSEPELFLKKVIEELENLDLGAVNRFLLNRNKKELDFKDIVRFAFEYTVLDTCELLIQRLNDAIKEIENAREQPEERGLSREKRYLKEDGCSYWVMYTLKRIRDEICFFKYKIILITKDAGQGKTNFLCDFTRNFLLKKKFSVLFYNAYDFREPFMNLIKKELTVDEEYSWEYVQQVLNQKWQRNHEPVIIIIDGLNENTALNDFGGYVSDFLKETQKFPFMKVVLSTRNELFEERFGQLNSDEFGGSFYRMDMKYQSDKFKERIFWGYLKYFDIEVMENSLLDRTYEILARDTLLLRFFCEVNSGKKQVRMLHVYKYNLFKKYYEMKKKESVTENSPGREAVFEKLIDHVCQLMIDSQQFSKVSRSQLTEEELTMFDKLLEADIIFKQEIQTKKGLLNDTDIFIGFTFDEFRDFCITRFILKNNDEKTFSGLWKKMHLENWSILEGVERYIFFLARTEGKGILTILKNEEEYTHIYWANVWELEEADITKADIQMWKEELLSDGVHAASVVNFLLTHTDRSYFKNVNIDLLFEMFNFLANDLAAFDSVTQKLFGKTQKDFYGRKGKETAAVLPCDELTASFKENKEDIEFIRRNKDFLRLSIYMMEIDVYQIRTMWVDIYSIAQEEVEDILGMYVIKEHLPQLIYHNIELIFEAVFRKFEGNEKLEKLKAELDARIQKYDYKAINDDFASIWNL